jgi:hypothetical protein
MISVLSQHLPLIFTTLKEPFRRNSLELAHLVESARYHKSNLIHLGLGNGHAPSDFNPGIDCPNEERDRYWQVMGMTMEFESFLFSGKRFLDGAWLFFRPNLKQELPKVDSFGGFVNEFKQNNSFSKLPYLSFLVDSWHSWGKDLSDLRNYTEHESPLGGTGFGFTLHQENQQIHTLCLPETIFDKDGKRIPKKRLSYTSNKTAADYVNSQILNIDTTFIQLINFFNESIEIIGKKPAG